MPIAASWTSAWTRAAADLGHLLRFRTATRGRRRFWTGLGVFTTITIAAAVIPAFSPGAGGDGYAFNLLILLPSAMAGFLLLAIGSAIASGGGRELVARDQVVAFPISPTTDHLGALLLAPLNIAWLIQSWLLLGSASYALGRHDFVPVVIGLLPWIAASTAIGQVVAWTFEWLRRLPGGLIAARVIGLAVVLAVAVLQVTHHLAPVLDRLPTSRLVALMVGGWSWGWAVAVVIMVALFVAATVLGAVPATLAAHRVPREETSVESGHFRARPTLRSDLAMMIRIDRASVWRAVPMRRGVTVLAIGPGLVAIAGGLAWHQLMILPGLVASGGALLFGVNAWTLEGRGILWRESLPVEPRTVFAARAWVLFEFLWAASAVTLLLAALRAGPPTSSQLAALLCTWIVVLGQVVSAGLRWSARSPYSVDLRSARSTPAPPLAMVGYSSKLALTTTLTSLIFTGLAQVDAWPLSVLVAAPFVGWSAWRLLTVRDRWLEPAERARIVMTVAG
ncbi:hypothetical protein [Nocardioides sp. Kera G14]|uniref:hypothetical protein n=1 Tax=Nocardioides sp. Kera G14 TaxID=2884264 RepID=UPI001D104120|nr:hypothetical protein [Nocardioides sp. Kera G14]UDY23489.1 hypothetical protein LH076_15710 [Nocardioides sp. Kera G14]